MKLNSTRARATGHRFASRRRRAGRVALVTLAALGLAGPAVRAADSSPPTADFTWAPASPVTGESVTFTSTSSDVQGSITSTTWDLDNDGSYDDGSTTTVSRTFTTTGSKTVRIRVVDDEGVSRTRSKTVTVVANRVPTAAFSASPPEVDTGQVVTLTSSSTDPDGRPLTQQWDTNNNGVFGEGSGPQITTSFANNGTHRVNLKVTDSGGLTATTFQNIIVRNRLPQVAFAMSATEVDTGTPVDFDATASDPDGVVDKYEWDFDGNGTTDASGENVSRSFADNGALNVKLTVTDDDNGQRSVTQQLTVNNRPPRPTFDLSATEVDTGTPVDFSSTSTDPDGQLSAYEWDFDGNGTTDASGEDVTHSFADNGTPDVKLTVTDDDGEKRSVSRQLTVNNRPPQPAFDLSATEVDTGTPVDFSSTSTDPDGQLSAYEWDFDGNGTTDATGAVTSRSFDTDGDRTVTLKVTDDDGAARSSSQVVRVHNRAPRASFTFAPAKPFAGDEVVLSSTSTDPDGSVAEQRWDLDGDGQFDDATGPEARTTFTAGVHDVALEVVDDDGRAGAPAFDGIEVYERSTPPPPDPPPSGGSGPAAPPAPTATALVAPRLLAPFPTVRVRGVATLTGVRIDLLSVRTPGATRILIRCRGRDCPWKRKLLNARFNSGIVRAVRIPGFNRRRLRAGTLVEIFVTRRGAIGKYTRFKFRKLKAPVRVDRCTAVGAARAQRCPAG